MVESKWVHGRKVGIGEVRKLQKKAEMVKRNLDADFVRIWFFGHDGFAGKAKTFMQENGILWSTGEDLDRLLEYVNLRRLPKI